MQRIILGFLSFVSLISFCAEPPSRAEIGRLQQSLHDLHAQLMNDAKLNAEEREKLEKRIELLEKRLSQYQPTPSKKPAGVEIGVLGGSNEEPYRGNVLLCTVGVKYDKEVPQGITRDKAFGDALSGRARGGFYCSVSKLADPSNRQNTWLMLQADVRTVLNRCRHTPGCYAFPPEDIQCEQTTEDFEDIEKARPYCTHPLQNPGAYILVKGIKHPIPGLR